MAGDSSGEPLDGKSAAEKLALARAIVDAERRRLYTLTEDERKTLSQFITLTTQRRTVDATIVQVMNRLIRNHQQNMIALARSVR
jgi:hypothetical protein